MWILKWFESLLLCDVEINQISLLYLLEPPVVVFGSPGLLVHCVAGFS